VNRKINLIFAKIFIMIFRKIEDIIKNRLFSGKAIVVIGARQTGKTTSINNIVGNLHDVLALTGDDSVVRTLLSSANTEQIRAVIGAHKIVFIDEVQRIENIGLTSKIIVDHFKDVQLILSGSSSFEIKNSLSESLTGRKWEYILYPVAWSELEKTYGYVKSQQQLEWRMIYGMYPEVITHPAKEPERLKQLIDSYLYKDLLAFAKIKKPSILEELLKALALQIGSEVSYNELARLLHIDRNTVKSYIEILEKGFIVFMLNSYSRNIRNELKFSKKIFFWDNGIRNAIIDNFNPLSMRNDAGDLWENFMIAERIKRNNYENPYTKSYFWRTVSQQEIDYIEESSGDIAAFEFKWNVKKKAKAVSIFTDTYKQEVKTINRDNFSEFLNL
jgi:predicted AAA+ superfamily ATPase